MADQVLDAFSVVADGEDMCSVGSKPGLTVCCVRLFDWYRGRFQTRHPPAKGDVQNSRLASKWTRSEMCTGPHGGADPLGGATRAGCGTAGGCV